MTQVKLAQSLDNLEQALARLRDALAVAEPNQLMIDGTILRFEFVIELFWKTIKRSLAAEAVHVTTPRETLKAAYKAEWIQNETIWLEMLDDRNNTSHVYDEAMALKIYQHIRANFSELERAFAFLQNKFR